MCLILHQWSWPRRRGDGQDWQTCMHQGCGAERISKVQFRGPMRAAVEAIQDDPQSEAVLTAGEVVL